MLLKITNIGVIQNVCILFANCSILNLQIATSQQPYIVFLLQLPESGYTKQYKIQKSELSEIRLPVGLKLLSLHMACSG